jgi:excisionase family DNA binding protein
MSFELNIGHGGLMTLQQIAKYLAVSIRSVRRLIDQGELKSLRVGHQLRVSPRDLESYLSKQRR